MLVLKKVTGLEKAWGSLLRWKWSVLTCLVITQVSPRVETICVVHIM